MNEKVNLSDHELRTLQLIETEMIVEVDRICKKNGIQYSLDGGTLLGAVRHKGYIPWDDDADLIFTRHEYAKFYRACKKDLDTKRFFLQEYRTDENYRWGYAKLRRKNTEFIRINHEHMKYRTGICIDLFVLDHVPDHFITRRIYHGINYCVRKVLYSEIGQVSASNFILRKWYELLYKIPRNAVFQVRNRFAAICNQKQTKLLAHLTFPYPKSCRFGLPSECFDEYTDIEFEGMQFQVMAGYDKYLKRLYGNYMQLPPEEKRVGSADASKIELFDITLEEIQQRYQEQNAKWH